ncbi:cupin domain-containing protein [Pimelobacter simplex]|uniref:cupin domain-containing protein n=1 Tax=Nocardioides simplex TaxID=2045 RepID=UPI003AAF364B
MTEENTGGPAPSLVLTPNDRVLGALLAAGQRAGADSGDPQLGVHAVDTSGHGSVGVWECTPGGWPVTNRPDTEVCYILAGRATITDDASGTPYPVAAGDLLLLPAGWSGRWDVEQTVRKVYAIF